MDGRMDVCWGEGGRQGGELKVPILNNWGGAGHFEELPIHWKRCTWRISAPGFGHHGHWFMTEAKSHSHTSFPPRAARRPLTRSLIPSPVPSDIAMHSPAPLGGAPWSSATSSLWTLQLLQPLMSSTTSEFGFNLALERFGPSPSRSASATQPLSRSSRSATHVATGDRSDSATQLHRLSVRSGASGGAEASALQHSAGVCVVQGDSVEVWPLRREALEGGGTAQRTSTG
eukprot:347605-Chlamydomonas_euryale.AAC.2